MPHGDLLVPPVEVHLRRIGEQRMHLRHLGIVHHPGLRGHVLPHQRVELLSRGFALQVLLVEPGRLQSRFLASVELPVYGIKLPEGLLYGRVDLLQAGSGFGTIQREHAVELAVERVFVAGVVDHYAVIGEDAETRIHHVQSRLFFGDEQNVPPLHRGGHHCLRYHLGLAGSRGSVDHQPVDGVQHGDYPLLGRIQRSGEGHIALADLRAFPRLYGARTGHERIEYAADGVPCDDGGEILLDGARIERIPSEDGERHDFEFSVGVRAHPLRLSSPEPDRLPIGPSEVHAHAPVELEHAVSESFLRGVLYGAFRQRSIRRRGPHVGQDKSSVEYGLLRGIQRHRGDPFLPLDRNREQGQWRPHREPVLQLPLHERVGHVQVEAPLVAELPAGFADYFDRMPADLVVRAFRAHGPVPEQQLGDIGFCDLCQVKASVGVHAGLEQHPVASAQVSEVLLQVPEHGRRLASDLGASRGYRRVSPGHFQECFPVLLSEALADAGYGSEVLHPHRKAAGDLLQDVVRADGAPSLAVAKGVPDLRQLRQYVGYGCICTFHANGAGLPVSRISSVHASPP